MGRAFFLRIVSARAPYWRGGVELAPGEGRAYGLAVVRLECVTQSSLLELLADPHVDVSLNYVGMIGFLPVGSAEEFASAMKFFGGAVEVSDVGSADTGLASALDDRRLDLERERGDGDQGDAIQDAVDIGALTSLSPATVTTIKAAPAAAPKAKPAKAAGLKPAAKAKPAAKPVKAKPEPAAPAPAAETAKAETGD